MALGRPVRGPLPWLLLGVLAIVILMMNHHESRTPTMGLLLIISGDTNGRIAPCGCASGQLGGLARRGTYLRDAQRRAEVVYADAGGAAGGTSEYRRVQFE